MSAIRRHLAAADPKAMVTVRLAGTTGALTTGRFKREVMNYCFIQDLKLDIQQQRGFLQSGLLMKIEGPAGKILPLVDWMISLERTLSW